MEFDEFIQSLHTNSDETISVATGTVPIPEMTKSQQGFILQSTRNSESVLPVLLYLYESHQVFFTTQIQKTGIGIAIYAVIPTCVQKSYAWGKYKQDNPETHFLPAVQVNSLGSYLTDEAVLLWA